MTEDDKKPESEQQSEEFKTFRAAMKQIVTVRKIDVVKDLPKMFREHKPIKKRMLKKRAKKQELSTDHGQ